jgi:protein-disulfide isomerase
MHAQGRFWEFHDRLFNNQQTLTEPDLSKHAQAIGLSMPVYDKCMAAQLASPAKIRQDQSEGGRAGVTGTPTFFIGTVTKDGKLKALRRLVGAHPIANFRTTLDTLLAQTK